MKFYTTLCILVIIVAVPAVASISAPDVLLGVLDADFPRLLDNRPEKSIETTWMHDIHDLAAEKERIALTILADDVDLGHTVTVYAKSDPADEWYELGTLNTMAFRDNHGLRVGEGSKEGHLTETTFYIDTESLGDSLYVRTRLNSVAQDGVSRAEIESSIINSPEPASLILGTLGMSLVGYLRRRKTL